MVGKCRVNSKEKLPGNESLGVCFDVDHGGRERVARCRVIHSGVARVESRFGRGVPEPHLCYDVYAVSVVQLKTWYMKRFVEMRPSEVSTTDESWIGSTKDP